jgi:transcriptional regulator with XRE-family HTH domain
MLKALPITSLMSHGEITRALGHRVRAKRKSLNLSRKELSEKSGVSVPTISRLELTGVSTIAVLIKLAEALGAVDSLDSLFKISEFKSLDEFMRQED